MEQIARNLYTFQIPMPNNPLKWLNCYVIKSDGSGRDLLIDTGFNMPECREALLAGMKELSLLPENTDVFLTHCHSDHVGNARLLQDMGCRILISETEHKVVSSPALWEGLRARSLAEGMSNADFQRVLDNVPALRYAPIPFDASYVKDGDILQYGGYQLRCMELPGHARAHTCLYDEQKKIFFAGDHVLFNITPNICTFGEGTNALGEYLRGLDKTDKLDIALCLPAHRQFGSFDVHERIAHLKAHHVDRLNEVESYIKNSPGLSAFELTGRIRWKISAKNWADFPASQIWFAFGEAMAHIDYLLAEGRVERHFDGSKYVYF